MPDLARWMRPLAWASLAANIAIVVTGGAVRLTGSGLGCPTWPRCTDESFRPHGALEFHEAIEFGNRMLTFVLTAVAVLTFVAAWQTGRRALRVPATLLALGVPTQAGIGGVTVLTGLNSWVVALHLLVSMAMVGVAVLVLHRLDRPEVARVRGRVAGLAWTLLAVTWAVLYLGTVVTGAGPHAGDLDTERNGLDPLQVSQLHADAVFLLVGVTVGVLFLAHLLPLPEDLRRPATVLLAIELSQGAIGFVQYFTDLPELLVGFHMLGAALVSAAATWVVVSLVLPARTVRGGQDAARTRATTSA